MASRALAVVRPWVARGAGRVREGKNRLLCRLVIKGELVFVADHIVVREG